LTTAVLERMCKGRGLLFDRINPDDDLLLPPSGSRKDLEAYKAFLDHYAFRLLLKEIIKSKTPDEWRKNRRSVERFCNPEAVVSYLSFMENLGIVRDSGSGVLLPSTPVRNFGPTYEWYVSRVISSDLGCPSAWGVRFFRMESGGDHDVIASVSGHFLYLEAKTAPPKHIDRPEISSFIKRLYDIAPDIAIFHNDTHLRMKDKIVPLLEEEIIKRQCNVHPPSLTPFDQLWRTRSAECRGTSKVKLPTTHFERVEREIFHMNSCIYVMNSKPDLRKNLTTVFTHHFRKGNPILTCLGGGER